MMRMVIGIRMAIGHGNRDQDEYGHARLTFSCPFVPSVDGQQSGA